MAKRLRYLVDANVLMEAKRRYYRFALCPGFWECLVWQHKQGLVSSIDKVRKEIEEGRDDLTQWVKKECPKTYFAESTGRSVAQEYGKAMVWVQAHARYSDAAKAKFALAADGWLVAHAKVNNLVVVTLEAPAPESRAEVKIPDVCDQFGVKYADTFEMLEAMNTRFTWEPQSRLRLSR